MCKSFRFYADTTGFKPFFFVYINFLTQFSSKSTKSYIYMIIEIEM